MQHYFRLLSCSFHSAPWQLSRCSDKCVKANQCKQPWFLDSRRNIDWSFSLTFLRSIRGSYPAVMLTLHEHTFWEYYWVLLSMHHAKRWTLGCVHFKRQTQMEKKKPWAEFIRRHFFPIFFYKPTVTNDKIKMIGVTRACLNLKRHIRFEE